MVAKKSAARRAPSNAERAVPTAAERVAPARLTAHEKGTKLVAELLANAPELPLAECSHCGLVWPADDRFFPRDKRTSTGLDVFCRNSKDELSRKYREARA